MTISPSPSAPASSRHGATASLSGDPISLDDAYREHAASVLGLSRRLVGDPALAEEVTQEVFLRLWRRPERYDAERGSLRSFLLADCHGRSVDAVRSASARRTREEREAHRDERRLASDVAGDVCDAMVHDRVADLVQALPEAERAAISLAYSEHLTYREVAGVLGAPEGTVKGRIRSGLRRMRAEMVVGGIDGA